jgi:2'-5' RNA ligase
MITMLQTDLFDMPAAASETHRLFIGLIVEGPARATVDAHRRLWRWPPGATFPAPERFHLTLHFLGEVEQNAERALLKALRTVPVEPLCLVLDTAEVWRNGVATLQPREHAGLRVLHGRIGSLLGFEPDARWKPHVTLARKASQALPPESFPPIPWTVPRFELVWSRLGQGAPRYEALGRYPQP